MQRNIKLVRYQKYGNDLVLFEHLNAPAVPPIPVNNSDFPNSSAIKKSGDQKTHLEKLSAAPRELQDIYHSLCDYIESLGDDIVPNQLKLYLAYRKTKNIICIEIFRKMILLHLKINPDDIELEDGFTRDMRNIGHYGTGDLQVFRLQENLMTGHLAQYRRRDNFRMTGSPFESSGGQLQFGCMITLQRLQNILLFHSF